MYSGPLADRYTDLGTQTVASKNHFPSLLSSVVFKQKIRWISDQWFNNESNYFEMVWNEKIQTEKQNHETKRDRSKRGNCLQKCFHSFKY